MNYDFNYIGYYNSKPSWVAYDGATPLTVRWNLNGYWEMIGWEGIFCGEPRSTDSDSFPDTGWYIYDPNNVCSDANFDVTIGACPLPGIAVFESCCDSNIIIRVTNIPPDLFPISTNSYYLQSAAFDGCVTEVSPSTPANITVLFEDLTEQLGGCGPCTIDYPCVNITPTPTATPLPIAPTPTPVCPICATVSALPNLGSSTVINGVTVTASGFGNVVSTTFSGVLGWCMTPPGSALNTVFLGSSFAPTSFTYILTFSSPVNNISIRLINYSISSSGAESFTFTTNTGNPVLSSCDYCCATINGNVVTANYCPVGSPVSQDGGGTFTISNPTPFTTLTISGPGGQAGTIVDICTDSVQPPVTPTPTPTVTPTTPFCELDCEVQCGPSYSAYNATTCYTITSIPSTPPTSQYTLIRKSYDPYSTDGTYVYNPGYTVSGFTNTINDGLYTILNTPNLWDNTLNSPLSGPLNRCGVWTNLVGDQPWDTWIGFSTCLDVSTTKTYYIGIGADNDFKIILDGNLIVNTRLAISSWDTTITGLPFKRWNVYPITINSGSHVLELYGWNEPNFVGSLGCEIYDNTLFDLINATTLNDINIIFSSSGQTTANVVQDLNDEYTTSGYTCPDGFVYNSCTNTCDYIQFCYPCVATPTPTPSNTPSPTQQPVNTDCFPLLMENAWTGSGFLLKVYVYNPITSVSTQINLPQSTGITGQGIANTTSKLWILMQPGNIREWDITLSPWTAVWSRDISSPNISVADIGWLSQGLCVYRDPVTNLINPNILVSMGWNIPATGGFQVVLVDISGSVWSKTPIYTFPSTSRVLEDVIMNQNGKMIMTTSDNITGQYYITQLHYVGGSWSLQIEFPISVPLAQSIFQWGTFFYIPTTNGELYTIQTSPPYTTTLLGSLTPVGVGDSSQSEDCVTLEFTVPLPTPTPTQTPVSVVCCENEYEAPLLGNSVVINGITITGSGSGRVTPFSFPNPATPGCETIPVIYNNTVELGDNTPPFNVNPSFVYTMTFSSPINDFTIHLFDYTIVNGVPESFTVTTDVGNPTISGCGNCCTVITNNTITVSLSGTNCVESIFGPSQYGGSGRFTISAPSPFTTLTISGPGGGGGSLLKICEIGTPLTPTPTPTPTVTPTPGIPCIDECNVLFNDNSTISAYDLNTNTVTVLNPYITGAIPGSADIAHTANKIFMPTGNQIYEYTYTNCPFSASLTRIINIPSPISLGVGLAVKDNNTLISSNQNISMIEIDITTTNAVITTLFPIPAPRVIMGDILYTTSAQPKLLVTFGNVLFVGVALTQFDYSTGNIDVDININAINGPFGIFVDNGQIYVTAYAGPIWNVNLNSPYALTQVQDSGVLIGGASSIPECSDAQFYTSGATPTPTPTKTVTPTVTPTNTVTPTVTPTDPPPTYSPTPTNTPTNTATKTTTPTPTTTITPTKTKTPTPTPTNPIGGCCPEDNALPLELPVNINGVTISPTIVGSVSQGFPITFVPSCGSTPITLNPPLLLGQNTFTYTLSFSNPVNNVTIRLVNYRYLPTGTDSFTITTNNGNPTITSCEYCCATITNNTITASQDITNVFCNSSLGIGSGLFTFTTLNPFTTLTITGPGNGSSSVYASICTFDVIPAVTPTPTPTKTPTLTPTPQPQLASFLARNCCTGELRNVILPLSFVIGTIIVGTDFRCYTVVSVQVGVINLIWNGTTFNNCIDCLTELPCNTPTPTPTITKTPTVTPTRTPTVTPTKTTAPLVTTTPTVTPTRTKTPTPTRTKTPTPTPSCMYYRIVNGNLSKEVSVTFTPCCVTEISPLIIAAGGATSVCSSTIPSLPAGVTYTVLGNCPTC